MNKQVALEIHSVEGTSLNRGMASVCSANASSVKMAESLGGGGGAIFALFGEAGTGTGSSAGHLPLTGAFPFDEFSLGVVCDGCFGVLAGHFP